MKRLRLLVLLAVIALLALPAHAPARATDAPAGVVASFDPTPESDTGTLFIYAPNTPLFSQTLGCFSACDLTPGVVRLGPGPRPDVILEVFQDGGAGEVQLYDFAWSVAAHTWIEAQGSYSVPGPTVQPIGDGYSGFVSQATLGTFYPDRIGPIRIQQPIAGQLVDVTRAHPALIRPDAAHWLAAFKAADGVDNAPALTAWVADEIMLGQGTQAISYLTAQAGQLTTIYGPISVSDVEAVLRTYGYPPPPSPPAG